MSDCGHVLFGGIDLKTARDIHQRSARAHWARKNLWHVEVTSPVAIGGENTDFNFFCLSADYSPITLTGEKRKIGSAFADSLSASEPVDLRLTTLDDEDGNLKKWFYALSAKAAPSDGTVNPPAKYATRIIIRHAFVAGEKGVKDAALYRPGALEISLARGESALQELSLSFVQLDTFMPSSFMPLSNR